MALGARGISVIFAAGNGGVHGSHDAPDQCTNNTLTTEFPAACPYVTSVGATFGVNPEVAAPFSSGGFSNYFSRPVYQEAIVPRFLATLPEDFAGTFNRDGRGYPDVSTQGVNFQVAVAGRIGGISGTSAASPTFASVIALVNDRLIASGRPVLGFLNPWLYSRASCAFTDITLGSNPGFSCPTNSVSQISGRCLY